MANDVLRNILVLGAMVYNGRELEEYGISISL
jgi:hypothetical protein